MQLCIINNVLAQDNVTLILRVKTVGITMPFLAALTKIYAEIAKLEGHFNMRLILPHTIINIHAQSVIILNQQASHIFALLRYLHKIHNKIIAVDLLRNIMVIYTSIKKASELPALKSIKNRKMSEI